MTAFCCVHDIAKVSEIGLKHVERAQTIERLDGVPSDKRDAYRDVAEKGWALFSEWGASRQVECWSDDVPHGKLTDFFRAVNAQDGESVVFAWIEYPSKEARDAASEKMRSDPRAKEWGESMSFIDGKRMVFGGFTPILDKSS